MSKGERKGGRSIGFFEPSGRGSKGMQRSSNGVKLALEYEA